ncbi:hypothetical protein ABBQ38_004139 [Trebouxia sp. C0009 RCD-2024]
MLESPVTACKPAQEAATGSPERHALYQAMLHSSNSSHQQSLPSRLPCVMSPNGRRSEGTMQRLLSPPGNGAGTERRRQGQSPDKQAGSSCSMSGHATGAPGVSDIVGANTSLDLSRHGADAQTDAAAVSSKSASHHDGAVAGSAAHCCCDAIASAPISLECPPNHAQGNTGREIAVNASRKCEGPLGEERAHQDSDGIGLQVKNADTSVGASQAPPITAALLLQTPSGRRVSFTLPEGADCDDTKRTPCKGFKRSPRKASPGKPSAFSSFGSQQPKRVADVGVSDTAQEREVEEGMDRGCKRWVAEGGGSVMVFEQEQDVGYVDIPRRVAWERLSSPGRKRHALQVVTNQIDPLQQDCREAFLNEKLAFNWKAGQAWAQLDLAGIHFTQDMCSQHHAEWKAAAERFIEKRGYMAAEQLRATLQSEWQQLKAIRKRCCTSVSEGLNAAGQSKLLPRTPRSIMKRKSPFIAKAPSS